MPILKKIFLTKAHKDARVEIITEWFSKSHNWLSTAFSDEKKTVQITGVHICLKMMTHLERKDSAKVKCHDLADGNAQWVTHS